VSGPVDGRLELAVCELETWLRQNRGVGGGWPAAEYGREVDAVMVRYLRGYGWRPDMPPDVAGPVADRWRAIADGVHEAGVEAWVRVTGSKPRADPGPVVEVWPVAQ
jgi:hypothetical protein